MARYVILNGVRTRYEEDGSQTVQDVELTQALDYDGAGHLIYHGLALPGASKAAANWQLRKLSYDVNGNPTDIQYANASRDFDQVWDTRAAQTYS